MQVTTTTARAGRRASIAIAALLALVAGVLVPSVSDAATKYPYKAPPSVAVANVGKDYAEIVFGTVTGAPTYKIKAEALDSKGKVVSGKTKYASTGPEGYWTITGLSPATKYKFTVAVEQPSPKKLLSKYSTKSATATTNKASYLDAPISVTTRDDPNDTLDKNGQRPYSIDLMWLAPAGFDPDLHQFQVDYATDRVMKTKKGSYRTGGALVPELLPQASSVSLDEAEVTEEVTTELPAETPTEQATEPATTPTVTTPDSSLPTITEEVSPAAEPPSSEPATDPATEPAASPTGEAETEQVSARSVTGASDVVLLSVPIRPTVANATAQTYWARVPSLTSNTNWYMRVKIVRKSDGAVLSERSEAQMVKTLSPKGYITGTVNLNGQPASKYVVAAYSGTDLHDQVDVNADGSYQLSVRPGTYQVIAIYIGSENFSSRWASGDPTRGKSRYDDAARSVTVAAARAVTGIDVTPQSTASFTVSGDIDCPGAASTQCTVDVAAMSNWHTDTKRSRVVNSTRSNSSGSYSLSGLPAGKYKLRIGHADERYKAKNLYVEIHADGSVAGNPSGKLEERAWLKTYPAKIKRTGSTVKVTSKAYIASELPIVRAVQRCQWQRNGANIGGATKCTYKLTSADRGKSIRVRITNERYGFPDHTTYSKAIKG